MATDLRNTPISTSDPQTLALYEQAVREYQSYVGDPTATLDRALADQPDFVLAHLFKAAVLASFNERRFFEQARASIATAEALLAKLERDEPARVRERGLLAACKLLVDGDSTGACLAFDRVLVEFPCDIVALQTAHLFDFARGDAKNLRDRLTRVLPSWSESMTGYSYVLGMRAFGLEECNQYDEARASAERALELERTDAWAVHAIVHVNEMRGRVDDGIRFLESREADWAPHNGFAFHNFWHLALFNLEHGNTARVLELYDQRVYPEPSDIALQMVDASSLLWRLYLRGVDVGQRFERVADVWQTKLDGERGFYAFNDVHAMMAFAATGRHDLVARLARDLEAPTTGTNAMMAREVGIPVARALAHFATGSYERCIDELVPVREIANRFGGSHAQRDLLTLTLIEAARRSGHHADVRHFRNERNVPRAQYGW